MSVRKFSLCVAFFGIMTGSCFAQFGGTSFNEATRTKKAKLVCLYSETPGYITTAEPGKTVGMLPEIMNFYGAYLKKNNGMDVAFDFQPFKKDTPIASIFEIVNNSKDGVFGLVFIFITEERKKTLNFSNPIFESPSFLLTSGTAPDVNSMKEAGEKLKGYTAYVNQGNYYEDRLKELRVKAIPDLKIDYFKTYGVSNISETVVKDKTMLYVDISGLLYAMEKKLAFKNHKALQLSTPMGIILSRQSTWNASFNKFLKSGFLESTEFKKIIADNLGYRTLNLLKLKN